MTRSPRSSVTSATVGDLQRTPLYPVMLLRRGLHLRNELTEWAAELLYPCCARGMPRPGEQHLIRSYAASTTFEPHPAFACGYEVREVSGPAAQPAAAIKGRTRAAEITRLCFLPR